MDFDSEHRYEHSGMSHRTQKTAPETRGKRELGIQLNSQGIDSV